MSKLSLTLFFVGIFLMSCSSNIPEEKEGFLLVEAENFDEQTITDVRKWHIIKQDSPKMEADPDSSHAATASGGVYLELLPDTRKTHDDQLIKGENFINEPGKMAVLNYSVKINNPGKFYVWVKAFSTGTEDNGIHVGLNGQWPESGQRMQWCDGKHQWTWDSKQRTAEEHCGVEKMIYLDIDEPGMHTISFSMREDGFEFDQLALTREYRNPQEYIN